MKRWLKNITLSTLSICLLVNASCGQQEEQAGTESPLEPGDFAHFPNYQFQNLRLTMPLEQVESILSERSYVLTDEGETKHFIQKKDSVEIFVPEAKELSELKVFLKSRSHLNKKREYKELFQQHANEYESTKDYDVYHFVLDKYDFDLTMFASLNNIRLNFVLRSRRG